MSRKRTFVVPAWTQLATRTAISNAIGSVACGWIQAQYTDGSGFYKWHTDGCSVSLRIAKLYMFMWLPLSWLSCLFCHR